MSRIAALLAAVLLPIALLCVGLYVGAHPSGLPGGVQDLLGVNKQQEVVREATDDIKKIYYRRIGNDALADASIAGMVKSLNDRFSNYFTPKQYADFKQQTSGQFSGVGMTVTKAPTGLKVVSTYPKSGAREAGILQGDVVIAANGIPLAGKNETVATGLVKGPPGTSVVLTWTHNGKKVTERVKRATVSVPVVSSRLATCNGTKVAVVRLAMFSSGAHAQVYAALRKQIKRGAKAVVLDLRANGGGLVTEAQLVASAFLKDGAIVTTRGRDVPSRTLSATGDTVAPNQPVVVLVDGGTASASEIVAGALQDRKRATLVGNPTFGKGVFQEILNLSNGGALDITAGQYFLPSGRNIGGVGVKRGTGLVPTVKTPVDDTAKKAAAGERLAVCTAADKV
jgi:carboxyl-terminal processing protease